MCGGGSEGEIEAMASLPSLSPAPLNPHAHLLVHRPVDHAKRALAQGLSFFVGLHFLGGVKSGGFFCALAPAPLRRFACPAHARTQEGVLQITGGAGRRARGAGGAEGGATPMPPSGLGVEL